MKFLFALLALCLLSCGKSEQKQKSEASNNQTHFKVECFIPGDGADECLAYEIIEIKN